MGYNTTIVICNDHLNEISQDPNFGKAVYEAAAKHWTSDKPVWFSHNSQVIAQHHADTTSLNLVGQNGGCCIGFSTRSSGFRNDEEVKIAAFKEIARSFGYKLVKMNDREQNRNYLKPYVGSGCIL